MTLDAKALSDRLYADALAAGLRVPGGFSQSRTEISRRDVEAHVRKCAEVHRKDLSATPAEADRAVERALSRWRESATGEGPWREVTLLVRAARKLLQADGPEMILRVDRGEPGREILRWRFTSLVIPPGILIAAATRSGFAPSAVRLLDSSIAPDQPVAQHHVHHAAMMSFEELWASLRLRALMRPGELAASVRVPRAFCPELHRVMCPWGRSGAKKRRLGQYPLHASHVIARAQHMAEWSDLIRQAFIAGYVLNRHSHHVGKLENCLNGDCTRVVRTTLQAFLSGRTKPYSETGTPFPWPEELILLARRSREMSASAVRRSEPCRADLMCEHTAEERRFLVRAFAYMNPDLSESPDPDYEKLFMQYLRLKSAIFGLLVHPPGEHGLANFLEHFEQIKVYVPESDARRPRIPHEPGLEVRATEYRVAPDAWLKTLERPHAEIEGGSPALVRPEAAWLIHFKRKGHDRTLPLFGAAVHQLDSEADQIARALATEPRRLKTLRGIDICGVEEAQPLWVSVETLRRLRLRSCDIASSRPGLALEPLHLTLHAGEDFTWLTSGVRAIAEPFHWRLIERGDRIGHGIAITLHPRGWWHRRKGKDIHVRAFDRLLDLAFLAEYTDGRTIEQEEWLRLEMEFTVAALGFEPHREEQSKVDFIQTAKDVWSSLGGRLTRRLMQRRHLSDDADRHVRWIHKYLWNRSTQQRSAGTIAMKVDDDRNGGHSESYHNERDLLVMARKRLIHELAHWQVCIECNPSSNLVVGSLDSMAAQDFLHRRPTKVATPGKETLTWTISTDDPITFSTTLADEYAYAWAGMVLRQDKPYDPSYARAVLDEAAATSMRMRFTIPSHGREHSARDEH